MGTFFGDLTGKKRRSQKHLEDPNRVYNKNERNVQVFDMLNQLGVDASTLNPQLMEALMGQLGGIETDMANILPEEYALAKQLIEPDLKNQERQMAGNMAGRGMLGSGMNQPNIAGARGNALMSALQTARQGAGQRLGQNMGFYGNLLGQGFQNTQAFPSLLANFASALSGQGMGAATAAQGHFTDRMLGARQNVTDYTVGAMKAAAAASCHIAREVFGNDNLEWVRFFIWKESKAPTWFKNLYDRYSESVAKFISNKPRIKSIIRSWMRNKILKLDPMPESV